jgi:hypothetical protein
MKARNIAGFLLEEESERKGTILLLIPNIIVKRRLFSKMER